MRIGAFEISDDEPKIQNAIAIASLRPWVDVGRVGTLVLNKLERYLNAVELGRLARPGTFLDFTRERPHTRIVEGKRVLTKPNSIVRYAKDVDTGQDFLFLHLREPHMFGEDYAESIVKLLRHYNVAEYCRIESMWDSVPHTRPLLITGTLNELHEGRTRGLVSIRKNTYQGPTSIVNLVGDTLAEANVQSASLMLHIPHYVQLDEDHMGAARIMEVISAMYDFPPTLTDTTRGEQQYRDISRAVESNAQVKQLVAQLEDEYDRVQDEPDLEFIDDPTLPPEMEKFLNEMGQRFEEGPPRRRANALFLGRPTESDELAQLLSRSPHTSARNTPTSSKTRAWPMPTSTTRRTLLRSSIYLMA